MDHRRDLISAKTLGASQGDQLIHLGPEHASLDGADDANPATAGQLQQTLIAKDVQGFDDGVLVHAEFRGEVHDGREALSRADLALGDRSANPRGDLKG